MNIFFFFFNDTATTEIYTLSLHDALPIWQLMDSVAAEAIKEVKKSGVFVVPGLGRLVRVDRKARMGRNPATGEAIKIPAKKVVKFRVAKAAKDAIVPPKVKRAQT